MANILRTDRKLMRAIDGHMERTSEQVEEAKRERNGKGRISEKLAEFRDAGLRKMNSRDRERFLNKEDELKKLRNGYYADMKDYQGKLRGDAGGAEFRGMTSFREQKEMTAEVLRVEGVSGVEALKR